MESPSFSNEQAETEKRKKNQSEEADLAMYQESGVWRVFVCHSERVG
jgi:hypothetical protein